MRNYLNIPTRKPRTLKAMREYLINHPARLGWIGDNDDGLGICRNVKIRGLHLRQAEDDACYRLLGEEGCYQLSGVVGVLQEFGKRNPGYAMYQAGRSAGYFILQHNGTLTRGPVWANEEDCHFSQDVRHLFRIVWDFDQTCNDAVGAFVEFALSEFPAETEPA